jgi:ATP phosphoribosyltransferase regulatory subunit
MVYQPPTGARDLLPLDVTQKQWIEERLRQVFHRWGYHRIVTSTLERLDTLMAGGAIDRATVIQVQSSEEGELGLRPELTASIARTAATRLANAPLPLRLYYSTNVFRKTHQAGSLKQQEFYQAGVELLGSDALLADAEILLLLQDCLANLDLLEPAPAQMDLAPSLLDCTLLDCTLLDCTIVLGSADFTKSLLATFPPPLQPSIRQAIAHLDRFALEHLPLPPEQQQLALALFDLRGKPEQVFARLEAMALSAEQQAVVDRLIQLTATVQASQQHPGAKPVSLILDLSLIQTFDYYTGIVFEVVCSTPRGQWVVGQGGRYDQLLSLYHPQSASQPGIGFCLDIEELQKILLTQGGLPNDPPTTDWLVIPLEGPASYAQACDYAQSLRQTTATTRVELYLERASDRSSDRASDRASDDPAASLQAQVQAYAQRCKISNLAWVPQSGEPKLEILS